MPYPSLSSSSRKMVVATAVVVLLLTLCFDVSSAATSSTSTAYRKATEKQLRFRGNGEFKILQVADMHYADGKSTPCQDVYPSQLPSCSDLNTTAFVLRLIKAEKPDLIVFTGKNMFSFVLFVMLFCRYK